MIDPSLNFNFNLWIKQHNRYPLSSKLISTTHAHISIQAQTSVYKEYLRISVTRTRLRPMSSQERVCVADLDVSAVYPQHATESSFHFSLNARLKKREKKMTAVYGVGKFQEFIFAYNS